MIADRSLPALAMKGTPCDRTKYTFDPNTCAFAITFPQMFSRPVSTVITTSTVGYLTCTDRDDLIIRAVNLRTLLANRINLPVDDERHC